MELIIAFLLNGSISILKPETNKLESISNPYEFTQTYECREPVVDSLEYYINEVSHNLGICPRHLKRVIKIESGFNLKAYNKSSGAYGLIQFIPSTRRRLGALPISSPQWKTYKYQFYLIEKYFNSIFDMMAITPKEKLKGKTIYLAVFAPIKIRKNIIYSESDGALYSWNKVLDYDKNSVITASDIEAHMGE